MSCASLPRLHRQVLGAPHNGAQYAYLRPPPTDSKSHYLRSAGNPSVDRGLSVAWALTLFGLEGRLFCGYRRLGNSVGWSRVVWDMLEATSAGAARHHRGLYRGPGDVYRVGLIPSFALETPTSRELLEAWDEIPDLQAEPDSFDDEEEIGDPPGPMQFGGSRSGHVLNNEYRLPVL